MSQGNDEPPTNGDRLSDEQPAQVPDDGIVVRFRPSAAESVLASAQKEHRRRFDPERPDRTFYRLSVFVGVKIGTESDEDVCARLIQTAGLSGLNLAGQKNYWHAAVRDLKQAGVPFFKDHDDDELEEHYSLDLGSDPSVEDVEKVLQLFDGPERMRP